MRKEIHVPSFVNDNYEIEIRNRKAMEYSKSVAKRKRDKMIENIVYTIVSIAMIVFTMYQVIYV